MASKRSKRPSRIILLLICLALVLLLLELNRFLPGLMPGGGGAGSWRRDAPDPAVLNLPPADAEERATGALALRAAGMRVPPAVNRRATVMEVRLPDGTWLTSYRVTLGGGGAASGTADAATGQFTAPSTQTTGGVIRVDAEGGAVHVDPRLGTPPPGPWAFVVPTTPPPRARSQGTVSLPYARRLDSPAQAIEIHYPSGRVTRATLTDASGNLTIQDSQGPVRVQVGSGTDAVQHWIHPRAGEPELWRIPSKRTYTWPDGGAELLDVRTPRGTARAARLTPGRDGVEVEAAGDEPLVARGRFRGREFLARLGTGGADASSTGLPGSREVAVRLVDASGQPVANASVSAAWEGQGGPRGLAEPMTLRAEARKGAEPGTYILEVPVGEAVRIVAGAPGKAASAAEVEGAADSADLTLAAGREVSLRILDAEGKAVTKALVYVVSTAGTSQVMREARSGRDGRAVISGVAGPAEVFAKAPGYAWGRAALAADSTKVDLALVYGYPLRLRVADAHGVPQGLVRVDVAPEDTKSPLVLPPREGALRIGSQETAPWEQASLATRDLTDVEGILTVPDLPIGGYTVRLHRSDLQRLTVRRITPGPRTWFLTVTPKAD